MLKKRTLASTAFILFSLGIAKQMGAKDYYFQDFEDRNDMSFYCCGPPFMGSEEKAEKNGFINIKESEVISKMGSREEHVNSGIKAFKLDIVLKKGKGRWGGFAYWRGPEMNMKLDKTAFISAFVYPEKLPPDIDMYMGFEVDAHSLDGRDIKNGLVFFKPKGKKTDGWICFEGDIWEQAKQKGWKDLIFKRWVFALKSPKGFYGQHVTIYLDDIRVSSEKLKGISLEGELHKSEIISDDPYIVNYTSYFKDRPDFSGNILDNPSFEIGMKNWNVKIYRSRLSDKEPLPEIKPLNTKWEIDDTEAFQGSKSLKISRAGDIPDRAVINSEVNIIEDGKPYTLSFYAKSDAPAKLVVEGRQFDISRDWKRISIYMPQIKSHGTWSKSYRNKYIVRIEHKGSETIWIDAVQLQPGKLAPFQMSPTVEFGVAPTSGLGVYHQGQLASFCFSLFNASEKNLSPNLSYKILNYRNEKLSEGMFNLNIPADSGMEIPLPLPFKRGYYKIRAKLEAKGQKIKYADSSFGFIKPLSELRKQNRNDFEFFSGGIPTYFDYDADLRAKLGTDVGITWGVVYNHAYLYHAPVNWRENNPQWIKLAHTLKYRKHYGIESVVFFGGFPKFMKLKEFRPVVELNDKILKEIYDHTFATVSRFKDRVKYWGAMPEYLRAPLEKRAKIYAEYTRELHNALKKADPNAVLVGPSEDTARNADMVRQIQAIAELGVLKYFDILGIEPYLYPLMPESQKLSKQIDDLNKMSKKFRDGKELPIWATESGWWGLDTLYYDLINCESYYPIYTTELEQAQGLIRINLICMFKGVKRFDTFALLSFSRDVGGLSNYNGVIPKCLYIAYGAMAETMAGAKPEKSVSLGKNIRCYAFAKGDKALAVLWNYGEKGSFARILFPRMNVKVKDMVGNLILPQVTEDQKYMILEATGSPLYLISEKKPKETFIKNLESALLEYVEANAELIGKNKLRVNVGNFTGGDKAGTLKISAPQGWQGCDDKPRSIYIAQNKWGSFDYDFSKINFNSADDKILLNIDMNGVKCDKVLRPTLCQYSKEKAVIDGDLKDFAEAVPINLSQKHWGSNGKTEWKGEKDLSATVYPLWDKENLYLGVSVCDDLYETPFKNAKVWANDSLQIAFDMKNDAISTGDGFNEDDIEMIVSQNPDGELELAAAHGNISPEDLKQIKCEIKRLPGKTIYELSIPWKALMKSYDPQKQKSIGFNLSVNDNDGKYPEKFQYLQITNGILGRKAPAYFRDLIMMEKENKRANEQ